MTTLPDAAIGPLLAAVIAALISLLGLIITKENKTSEFRHAWIDALRADLSAYIAHFHNIFGLVRLGIENNIESWARSQTDLNGVNKSGTNIRLRLNPKEGLTKRVIAALDGFERLACEGASADMDKLEALELELLNASQLLLKSEWRRVKHGELVFQIARAVSFAVLIAALGFVLWLWRVH